MPLKSWGFSDGGHWVRIELVWRFTGRCHKRVYVDHRRVAARRGRFSIRKPFSARIGDGSDTPRLMEIRFRPRRFGRDVDCEVNTGEGLTTLTSPPVRIEWLRRPSWEEDDIDREFRGLGCLLVLPLIVGLVIAAVPMTVVGAIAHWRRETRLKRQMRDAGRWLTWAQIKERMRYLDSPCTLVVQFGGSRRAWWTTEDVASCSPLPPVDLDADDPMWREPHLFFDWCEHQYLSSPQGKAFLIELPGNYPILFDDAGNRVPPGDQFPMLRIVITGHARKEREQVMDRLAPILANGLSAAIPALIAGLTDKDPTMRATCREAITLAGPLAADAVSTLTDQLYHGQLAERYRVAKVLPRVGVSGIEAVKQAAKVDDPYIRRYAQSSLWIFEQWKKCLPRNRVAKAPQTSEERILRKKIERRPEVKAPLALILICVATLGLAALSGWYLGELITAIIFGVALAATLGLIIWLMSRRYRDYQAKIIDEEASPSVDP